MIIGIDGNEANVTNRVGIGEYAYQLLLSFYEKATKDISFRIYLKNKPEFDMPKQTDFFKYEIVGPSKAWTQIALPIALYFSKNRPDIIFTPGHYAPRFSPVPRVISIMDVAYLRFPDLYNKDDLYQLKHWTKYSALKAKRIFTISQSSKNDIIKYYNVVPKNVDVTFLGINENKHTITTTMKEIEQKFGISGKYILFVGTLQPRKNIVKLIEAFSLVKKNKEAERVIDNVNMVIVGKKGWKYEEILEAPSVYGVKECVSFLEFVDDDELTTLYKNALCFILPSLYEGFGLPILEAMRNDCPVITSNISSLPEAGGDAALYVDPNSSEDIAKTLTRVISDEKLRKSMIEKGKTQVKKFSWNKTASETLEGLEEVVHAR